MGRRGLIILMKNHKTINKNIKNVKGVKSLKKYKRGFAIRTLKIMNLLSKTDDFVKIMNSLSKTDDFIKNDKFT